MTNNNLYPYLLQLADNALILGHRLSEWCGHGPVLEQDMAMTNIALDLVGQSRSLYQYAAQVENKGRTEDDLAYLREIYDYKNVLLVEQPNGNFADTIARQFLFDAHHYFYYQALTESVDEHLAAIAARSLKEITYHLRHSSEWMLRLGDGTKESHRKIQQGVDNLWRYTGELHQSTELDEAMAAAKIAPNLSVVQQKWEEKVTRVLRQATLKKPQDVVQQNGGKNGNHTEYLGHLLTDLQYLQRMHPGAEW